MPTKVHLFAIVLILLWYRIKITIIVSVGETRVNDSAQVGVKNDTT